MNFDTKIGAAQRIYKFSINFEPEIPETSKKVRIKIINSVKEDIKKKIGQYKFIGNCIYALNSCDEGFSSIATYDSNAYTVSLKWVQVINENDNERYTFIKILFNSLLKRLHLEQIGKGYFSPKNAKTLEGHDISVWPGFISGLKMTEYGVIINVDVSHRVLRNETVLQRMVALKSLNNGGVDESGKTENSRQTLFTNIVGKIVMTKYNQKTYRVSDIDFSASPENEFQQKDGTKISYFDYYKNKYGVTIQDKKQPLLINENIKTGTKIVLIPELWAMTGLSDEMRTNFRLMKDLSKLTNVSCDKRLKEWQSLFKIMKESQECQEEIKRWNIVLSESPVEVKAKKVDHGLLLMGSKTDHSSEADTLNDADRIQVDANADDVDRKIQTKMFSQPKIKCWGIFWAEQEKKNCTNFVDCLKQSIKTFKYDVGPPRIFYVKSKNIDDWRDVLKKNLNPNVECVVLILPGNKNNFLYKDVKALMLHELPIPSQVILTSTISRGKNLRSIWNKILIQICAKVGGVPWTVSDLPTTNSMICGIDINENKDPNISKIVGFVSSIDKQWTRYYSTARVLKEGQDIWTELTKIMKTSLTQYKTKTGEYPANVIVYRNGASESEKKAILGIEVPQYQKAFEELDIKGTKLAVILVYSLSLKGDNVKFFNSAGSNISNPEPGTLIDSGIIGKAGPEFSSGGSSEFYLISQKTLQGTVVPTHYSICFNNTDTKFEFYLIIFVSQLYMS